MDGAWLRRIGKVLVVALAVTGLPFVASGAASADPASSAWAKLRMCESSDRYTVNTGNGYYGAYQFDLPTWRSVGGQARPDLASPAEQDYRALYLYRVRGWQPWQCAGMLGLTLDRDARSGRVPTYAESAYIGGGGSPAPPPVPRPTPPPPPPIGPKPPWPGVVYAYGDCAPALKQFQLRMNAFGYGFTGTGCYYDKTRQAVLDIQRANGINASGRLGPKTWDAAWEGKPPR